jgi:hypothetical protein
MPRPTGSACNLSLEERIKSAMRLVRRPLSATEFKLLPKLMGCRTSEIAEALAKLVERGEVVERTARKDVLRGWHGHRVVQWDVVYELADHGAEGGGT